MQKANEEREKLVVDHNVEVLKLKEKYNKDRSEIEN